MKFIISDVRGIVRQEDCTRCDVGPVHPTFSGQHDVDARYGGWRSGVLRGLENFETFNARSDALCRYFIHTLGFIPPPLHAGILWLSSKIPPRGYFEKILFYLCL